MKKIVLSLAVLASVALVSCNKGAATAESDSAMNADSTEMQDESATATDSNVNADSANLPEADSAK